MSGEYIVCDYCGRREFKNQAQYCTCGSVYCSFNCLVKGLHEVGVLQYSFNTPVDRCSMCAIEKLRQGKLTFPWGNKYFKRVLAPHLLIYVNELDSVEIEPVVEVVAKAPIRRTRKVSENQMSLF